MPPIETEQLIAALERLEPTDREVLDLSLRRRVPDSALADVLGCEPGDVPRRRASAIDRLAEELGVQRGEDLGHMLRALLDADTWAALGESAPAPAEVRPPEGEVVAFAGPGRDSEQEEAPREDSELQLQPVAAVEPEAEADAEGGPPPEPAGKPPGEQGDAEATGGPTPFPVAPPNGDAGSTPVLEMLADEEEPPERTGSRSALWILAGTLGAAALLAGSALAGDALLNGDDSADTSGADQRDAPTRHFKPQEGGPLAAPFASDPANAKAGYLTATIRKATVLYRRPGGPRLTRLSARTEWRSPRVMNVVEQRGRWLAVIAPELKNGQLGWLPQKDAKLGSVRWSLHADLSQRRVYVRRDGRTVRKLTVAVGRSANPTPTGRFAVTDRLDVVASNSPYGCCVLALSGHQQKLPAGWPGGDRLAVHATSDVSSIGKPVSLGCMRVTSRQARWLIETVPLGTPVFIRS